MAGSPTAAWLPKRPELAPAEVSGPRFVSGAGPESRRESGRPTQSTGRATRPFRFGSENRPDPDPPLGVGSVIGDRYQILRLLGEGGMGRVYEAQHIVLRRRVALKLLRRDAASQAENLARFRQEALAASRIGAPEIVEVVDFASHQIGAGQQTYMVMELLTGESLEDWMDRNARLDEGLVILASLCDGLAAAHRAAVVHRDIKPANVFLPSADPTRSNQVRVKILDFGIAKITAGGEGYQTRQGALLGTPYYLAPERVMGAELTDAADIYSIGVMLYEMLTGNVPFVADSFMGILANHVHTAALDPRQAAPERAIPDAVAQLCMRLLDKQPGARPSAEQLAAELRSLLAQQGGLLAAVEIGPRGASASGVDTQVIAGVTRELSGASADRTPQTGGTGSAAALSVEPSVSMAGPRQSGMLGYGLGLGLAAALGVAAIASLAWTKLRDDPTTEPRAAEPPPSELAVEEVLATPNPAAVPIDPTPIVPGPIGPEPNRPEPSGAPSDAKLPVELEPPVEREPREAEADRKRARTPKQKPDPKPAAQPNDDPAPEPAPEPPQADPPKPEAEPGNELPTIKDDVYD